MSAVFAIIALAALVVTAALLVYVAALRRDERERSEARVAALSAAIGHTPHSPAHPSEAVALFAARPQSDAGAPLPRWGVRLGGVFVVALIVAVMAVFGRGADPGSGGTVAHASEAPLELLSLRHARDRKGLTVSGLVRNPRDAEIRRDTEVVVFAFDRAGAFVASGRAPLAEPALASGTASPFSVTIPDGLDVSRYRVSFRSDARVLPHVDRRREADTRASEGQP